MYHKQTEKKNKEYKRKNREGSSTKKREQVDMETDKEKVKREEWEEKYVLTQGFCSGTKGLVTHEVATLALVRELHYWC